MFLYEAHTEPSAETTRYSAFRTTPVYCKERNPFIGQNHKKKEKRTGREKQCVTASFPLENLSNQQADGGTVAHFCHLLAHRPKIAGQRGTVPAKPEPKGRTPRCKITIPVCSVRVRSSSFLSLNESRRRGSRFHDTQRACREETYPNGVERPGEHLSAQKDWERDWELKPISMLCVWVTTIMSGDGAEPPRLPLSSCSRLLLTAQRQEVGQERQSP